MLKFSPLDRTPEKVQWLWENIVRLSRYTLDDDHLERPELERNLADPQNLYFEAQEEGQPVGFISILPASAWSATVHAIFFDLRTRGRAERLNQLARWVMGHSSYSVLRAAPPATHRSSVALLRRMGWSEDGMVRAAFRRGGALIDCVLFSVTQEELANRRERRTANGPFRGRQQQIDDRSQERDSARDPRDPESHTQVSAGTHGAGGWDASDFWQLPLNGTAPLSVLQPNTLRADDPGTAAQHGGVEPGTTGVALPDCLNLSPTRVHHGL